MREMFENVKIVKNFGKCFKSLKIWIKPKNVEKSKNFDGVEKC